MKKIKFIIAISIIVISLAASSVFVSAVTVGQDDGRVSFLTPDKLGDVNADGFVNICDLVRFKEHLDGNTIKIMTVNANFDDVAEVNDSDLALLKNMLLQN